MIVSIGLGNVREGWILKSRTLPVLLHHLGVEVVSHPKCQIKVVHLDGRKIETTAADFYRDCGEVCCDEVCGVWVKPND